MSDVLTLSAEARDRAGKGASRALRREGRVPAVIYGMNEEPTLVHVEEKLLNKLLGTGHFFNSVVMVEVGGKSVRTRFRIALPTSIFCASSRARRLMLKFLSYSSTKMLRPA